MRSERDTGKSADADAAASDEPESAEVSDTQDAVSADTQQTTTSDPAALSVPVAVFVPTTMSLAQAPQPAANVAVTDDASAAQAGLESMTAAAAAAPDAKALPAQMAAAPATDASKDPTLPPAAQSALPAMAATAPSRPAAPAANGKPAESAKASDREGRDVTASSNLQAMLGDAFTPVSQAQAQPKADAVADTPLNPSAAPQDASRQDLSAMAPAALPLAAASAPAAREAAAEASLAVLGRAALNETRSRTPAAFDAAQSGVFALPTAGAATAARGSEMPAPVQANVPTPFAEPGFQQALGYQVSLLARDGIGEAELHLNPADMGPVSVQITMTGDQARVDFGADLAQTRQALEAGWAELASSLKDAGFTLSGGGVSDHARERQAQQGQAASQSFGTRSARDSGEASVVAPVVSRRVNGAVDVYA